MDVRLKPFDFSQALARTGALTDAAGATNAARRTTGSERREDFSGVFSQSTLANIQAKFVFHGKASHAAHSPHLGRSALDAVELMNVGVNYLREHMPSDARVHYAVTDSGGLSPNVVQARAEVLYLVRAARNHEAAELYERVQNVARGAALMTDCKLEIIFDKAMSR